MMGRMTSSAPEVDVRRAAAIVWRALVLFWLIGAAVSLAAGNGALGLVVVSYAVVLGAVPALVVGGTLSMLVEHRLARAAAERRAAVYGLLGALVAFLSTVVVLQRWSLSALGLGIVVVGAVSAAGACLWADRSVRRRDVRRARHPATLEV